MAKAREHKFFNNLPDFEKEAEEEKRIRQMPKSPSFSLDDMEEARKASYDKGHAEGLQNAKDSIEQQTEILIQSLTNRIHDLEQGEDRRHDLAVTNAIAIAQKSIQHLLPDLIERSGQQLILESLQKFFSDNTPKSNLTLLVHPDMIDSIGKHAQNLSPSMTIKGDELLSTVQARLEWADGTYEFKPDIMVKDILAIVNQYLPKTDDLLDDLAQTTHNKDDNDEQQDLQT